MKGRTRIYSTTLQDPGKLLLFVASGILGIMIMSLCSTTDTIRSGYSQQAQATVASTQHNVVDSDDTISKAASINNLTHTDHYEIRKHNSRN